MGKLEKQRESSSYDDRADTDTPTPSTTSRMSFFSPFSRKASSSSSSKQTAAPEPPPYTAPVVSPSNPPPTLPRTNLLSIKRKEPVSGQFVLDAGLRVPPELLAPGATHTLEVFAKRETVDVEMWVAMPSVPTPSALDDEPLSSSSGKMMDVDTPAIPRASVRLEGKAVRCLLHSPHPHYTISIAAPRTSLSLPSSFRGPITIHTYYLALSPRVARMLRVFSEIDGVRKCFVGDLGDEGYGEGAWTGPTAEILAKGGSVKLRFDDEVDEDKGRKKWW